MINGRKSRCKFASVNNADGLKIQVLKREIQLKQIDTANKCLWVFAEIIFVLEIAFVSVG